MYVNPQLHYSRNDFRYMKKKLILLNIVIIGLLACKKNDQSSPMGRFELLVDKTMLRGNMIAGQALTDSNVLVLAFKNAPAQTKATVSADTTNGLYISPVSVNIDGSGTTNVKLQGKPINDGTFIINLKVAINGTVYVCSKQYFVDLPNITAITFTVADTNYYNVTDSLRANFQIYPRTTTFTITAAPHLTAEIIEVDATSRILRVVADTQFVKGDVSIAASFKSVPVVTKTFHLTAFAAGDGTAAKPFTVPDAKRLARIPFAADQAYLLTADIVQPTSPLRNTVFTGSLDGGAFAINNFTINAATTDNVGFFSEIGTGGTVKNISFKNVNVTGQDNAGVVAVTNRGTITGVTVTGAIKGRMYVAAIAANNIGTVASCDASAISVTGDNNLGSLISKNNSGSSEAGNVILVVPASFPTEVYGVSTVQSPVFAFTPSDGTITVKSVPANLTAVPATGQKVTLTPAAGFVSGSMQLALQKNNLSAIRNVTVFSKAQGSIYDAGDGSASSPYIISTESALIAMATDGSKYYQLAADVTLTKPWVSVVNFTGSFDGKGFKIVGLNGSFSTKGGFAVTNAGTIANTQFTGVDITTAVAFGIIAGTNTGTIQNITVGGKITSTNSGDLLGGIAAEMTAGKITQCAVNLNMTSSAGMTGGILGRALTNASEVSYCTTKGAITLTAAKNRIGGIVGRGESAVTIKNCLSSMIITGVGGPNYGANGVGGIFGANNNNNMRIDECMFDGNLVNVFSAGGIGGVAANVRNCLVKGSTITIAGTVNTGSGGGICGTGKVVIDKCVAANITLSGAALTTLPAGGITSSFQNSCALTNSVVVNCAITNSSVQRVSGTLTDGTATVSGSVTGNYAAAVTGIATPSDNANGIDGATKNVTDLTQAFYQGLGYDFTAIWVMGANGVPALRNAGYNGNLPAPQQ